MAAFVDTSAFYAILDADDANHSAADTVWRQILDSDTSLYSNNYVLVETYALLQHRIGLDAVRTFTSDILPVLSISYVTEFAHRVALHSLLAAQRRRLSLVDCSSFETINTLGIDQVFCFDPHFQEQGFNVIPSR